MRFIIIPLLILLYIWWSYSVIKNAIKEDELFNNNIKLISAYLWLIITLICLTIGFIIFVLPFLQDHW